MIMDIVGRGALQGGNFGAQLAPTGIQAPGQGRQPGKAAFDQEYTQGGEVFKDAFTDQACHLGLKGLGHTGVVFDMAYPGADDFGLWVERQSKVISFAPWPRCPGPHLQVWQFLKSHFGGGS